MFKIGEFSKLTQVSVRMLRYYDETGLLKPAQTDPCSGYRMYSADQIPVLNRIIFLRDSGFHVSEIADALYHESQNEKCSLAGQLDLKYTQIQASILAAQEQLKKIELALNEIRSGNSDMHYQITMKSIPGCLVLSCRKIIPDYYAEGEMWKELSAFAAAHRTALTGETFSLYHDTEYKEQEVDVELCALVKKAGADTGDFRFRQIEPVPYAAATMVYGPFSNIAGVYQSFANWLTDNSRYKMAGQTRQIVHRGPWNEENPQNYLTEIQIPLEDKTDGISF